MPIPERVTRGEASSKHHHIKIRRGRAALSSARRGEVRDVRTRVLVSRRGAVRTPRPTRAWSSGLIEVLSHREAIALRSARHNSHGRVAQK